MPKIRKSVFATVILLGLLAVACLYIYTFYFPWTNGYRVYTNERDGYEYARSQKLSSASACPRYNAVPGFDVGCRAYFD